jgi:hypothetical protein
MKRSTRPPRFLQVMQVNIGKGGAAHEAALSLAYKNRIDLILVQEPWIHSNLDTTKPCLPRSASPGIQGIGGLPAVSTSISWTRSAIAKL